MGFLSLKLPPPPCAVLLVVVVVVVLVVVVVNVHMMLHMSVLGLYSWSPQVNKVVVLVPRQNSQRNTAVFIA